MRLFLEEITFRSNVSSIFPASLERKYSSTMIFGEKICFDGFWEAESQYRGGGWDERGRIEGIVSGAGEDINPPTPPPSMIQHP